MKWLLRLKLRVVVVAVGLQICPGSVVHASAPVANANSESDLRGLGQPTRQITSTQPAGDPLGVALLIGIDEYSESLVPRLSTPGHDVEALAALLRDRYGYRDVLVLRNAEATAARIHQEMERLRTLSRESSLVVYWAGHGLQGSEAAPMGYLVPFDGTLDPSQASQRDIRMEDLREMMRVEVPARHRLLVVDACFGGLLAMRGAAKPASHDVAFLAHSLEREVFQVMSSGAADQPVVDNGPGNHSVFAGAVLAELSRPSDYLTGSELAIRVQGKVRAESFDRNGILQTPEFARLAGSGDFVFWPVDSSIPRGAIEVGRPSTARRALRVGGWTLVGVGLASLTTSGITHARYVSAPLTEGSLEGVYLLNRITSAAWIPLVAGGLTAVSIEGLSSRVRPTTPANGRGG
jgi:hypothetical protein